MVVVLRSIATTVTTVPFVHEYVEQRAEQQDRKWQDAESVRAVLREQKERDDTNHRDGGEIKSPVTLRSFRRIVRMSHLISSTIGPFTRRASPQPAIGPATNASMSRYVSNSIRRCR